MKNLGRYALLLGASLVGFTGGTSAQLTGPQKQEMLRALNDVRANVNPPAQGMHPLTWNPALESLAQAWASACPALTHRTFSNRQNVAGYAYVGETLFASTGPSLDVQSAVTLWAAESATYDVLTNTCSADTCGHYTQLVWAGTTTVGCAAAVCPSQSVPQFLVCNYGPGGNLNGAAPYLPLKNPG